MARSERLRRTSSSARGRLVLGGAVALLVPLALACNSLIGLSDFEKTQCAGARCADDGGPLPDQFVEGGGPDVVTDAPVDAKGADPVSWAKWPMPNYGDGGPPEFPMSSPPLVVSGGLVTDTVTKLVWRSTLVPGDFSANSAESECQKIDNGAWRAPKRIELVTLLDYSRSTFVDQTAFTDLKNFRVWTTSEVRPFVSGSPDRMYWVVNFDTGAVEPLLNSKVAKILCVKAK